MANTFLTPDIIAKEALMVLENNLVMAGLVHRDYSPEFAKVGDTITIRKPAKFIAKNFTGQISRQDVEEGSTTVKLDRWRDVSVDVTSKELTLDIRDFSVQVVTPAMQAIAQAVDSDVLGAGRGKSGEDGCELRITASAPLCIQKGDYVEFGHNLYRVTETPKYDSYCAYYATKE